MVAQTSNDEWQSPPPRPGVKLPADCRQPQSARNPPSYVDAVRSRHSLSQPDSSKLLRTINSQMQYNSLPRPLPQRLQGCPANGFEASRRNGVRNCETSPEEVQPHSSLRTHGFQVYTKPPGPANHVPLMGSLRPASSATLPRSMRNPRDSREFQQPLSINVQPSDFQDRSLKQADKNSTLSASEWSHVSNGGPTRVPYYNGVANNETTGQKDRNTILPQDMKKYVPNEKIGNGSLTLAQFYQQSRFPAYRGNNPQYPRWGTLPSRRPNRISVPEPAVSLRTGPLGSYPDFNRPQAENPPVFSSKTPPHFSKSVNAQKNCSNSSLLEIDRQREFSDSRSPSSTNGCSSLSSADRGTLYPLHENEHAFRRVACEKSATLPTRKNRAMENFVLPPVSFHQSPPNIVRNGTSSHQSEITKQALQHEDPVVRNNSRDYYQMSPEQKNPCHTPEDVGLVMIVEARDLNIKSKDLVKPTARMAMSQDGFAGGSCSFTNNSNYGASQHFTNTDPMPAFSSNCTSGSYSTKEQSVSYLQTTPNETGQGVCQSRNLGSSSSRPYGESVLRRTPLSSSTASLSSELSSVSSRHKHSESALERLRSANRNCQSSGRSAAAQKKSTASPSPWLREEKEQLQKQHIQGIRRARDEEISYLEALPERSADQEERLRVWLLEREFQRRAEEAADEEEDDDEESLLERAELRERMLMMERSRDSTMDSAQSPKCNSSSDQWLRTSQAKQQPKPSESESGCGNLNGSFEVQQLNDLLETMNMSPVIRETASDDETEIKNCRRDSETDILGVNKMRLSKTTYPTLSKPSSNGKTLTSPCLEFCHSLNESLLVPSGEKETIQPPIETNHHSIAFSTFTASPKKFSSNPLPENFAFNTQPILPLDVSINGTVSPKIPTRGHLALSSNHREMNDHKGKSVTETDLKPNSTNAFQCKSKDYTSGIRSFGFSTPKDHDSPICKTIRELRSPDRGLVPNFGKKYSTDFSNRPPERKKSSIAKPETLPFQDKIRIFSLKAGEDSFPRDKVKNSRAQRELEVKFSSDFSKTSLTQK